MVIRCALVSKSEFHAAFLAEMSAWVYRFEVGFMERPGSCPLGGHFAALLLTHCIQLKPNATAGRKLPVAQGLVLRHTTQGGALHRGGAAWPGTGAKRGATGWSDGAPKEAIRTAFHAGIVPLTILKAHAGIKSRSPTPAELFRVDISFVL